MLRVSSFVAVLFLAAVARADEPITPAEAVKQKGKTVSVVMEVKSTHEQRGLHFLNSETDAFAEGNFVIFLGGSAMKKFEAVGIKNPSEHYKGKKIVVTGEVTLYNAQGKIQGQIHVKGPDDIKIDGK